MKRSADYARYDDERLVRLVAQFRAEALEELYERYSALVFGLALMIIGDQATAEEITMDVFMRVWQKAASYRPEQAKVSTWLTHVARHHAIDVLRRQAVRPDQSALSWDELQSKIATHLSDPQEQAEDSLQRERIRNAVSHLPQDQKQALLLAYFGGYTQSQIAEILEQPLGTVKTRIRLAMQKLQDLLRDEDRLDEKSKQAISTYSIKEESS
jgi:RNA polymerase sigma-70 factor (ECF subfamily)